VITLDQGGGGRPFVEVMPPPRILDGLVEDVAILHSSRARARGPWRIVPDASGHLLFHRYRDGRSSAMIVGPRTRYVDVSQSDRRFTVAVRFRPGALPALTGVGAWELRDRSVRLADALGAPGAAAAERLASLADAGEACAVLLSVVSSRPTRTEVDWRVRGLMAVLGARPSTKVRRAAQELGLSERSLRAATGDMVGLRPKEAARIVRLHRALGMGLAGGADAEVAYRAGYTDQAHCIREFKRLLGETPRAFRARGLASGRDGAARDADSYKTARHARR